VERVIGPLLAEALEAACVTFASKVEAADGTFMVRRLADHGVHQVEARRPAVITVTSDEANRPRLPKVKDIVNAKRKPVQVWTPADLPGLADGATDTGIEVREVAIPQRTARCELLPGEPADQAAALVQRLRALKLL
jgi:electron transfer flavoprotein beta subunit